MKIALKQALVGTDPKLHRMLLYWAATAVLYAACAALMLLQVRAGYALGSSAVALCTYGTGGTAFFYGLVRWSGRLGIAPRTLAILQALFTLSCAMWLYAIAGPLRSAAMSMLMVTIVFCTFALRPRQSLLLAAVSMVAMGAIMWWLAVHAPAAHPPAIEALTFAYMAASLFAIAVLTGEMNKLRARLKRQKEELLAALETIRKLATVDELTELANRRHMTEVLATEERRRPAPGEPTCIALIDLDHFKQVNDRFGHAAGDTVLRSFADAARASLRATDVLARWGGEEFLLMLPNTEQAEAALVLRRMAARVDAIAVPGVELERRLSFSAGLAVRADAEPFAATIACADRALYLAKALGRDRVVTA